MNPLPDPTTLLSAAVSSYSYRVLVALLHATIDRKLAEAEASINPLHPTPYTPPAPQIAIASESETP